MARRKNTKVAQASDKEAAVQAEKQASQPASPRATIASVQKDLKDAISAQEKVNQEVNVGLGNVDHRLTECCEEVDNIKTAISGVFDDVAMLQMSQQKNVNLIDSNIDSLTSDINQVADDLQYFKDEQEKTNTVLDLAVNDLRRDARNCRSSAQNVSAYYNDLQQSNLNLAQECADLRKQINDNKFNTNIVKWCLVGVCIVLIIGSVLGF